MTDDEFSDLWNRACDPGAAGSPHEALRDLHSVLVFHGSVMNGGLLDAVENYANDPGYPLPAVLAAYRSLGLGDLADRVEQIPVPAPDAAPDDWDEAEERANAAYDLDDEGLAAVVRRDAADRPAVYGLD